MNFKHNCPNCKEKSFFLTHKITSKIIGCSVKRTPYYACPKCGEIIRPVYESRRTNKTGSFLSQKTSASNRIRVSFLFFNRYHPVIREYFIRASTTPHSFALKNNAFIYLALLMMTPATVFLPILMLVKLFRIKTNLFFKRAFFMHTLLFSASCGYVIISFALYPKTISIFIWYISICIVLLCIFLFINSYIDYGIRYKSKPAPPHYNGLISGLIIAFFGFISLYPIHIINRTGFDQLDPGETILSEWQIAIYFALPILMLTTLTAPLFKTYLQTLNGKRIL
ncbi:hypothetical protein [Ostreibacterium oceani]|uniref:Uncharacterized protein n=1 Tax=Ostreibacterium oceani TaxID=2654998 RepID=A0A6N7EVQ2_9GAMM|nr:hypothetical protein [Ostreibacterium oceani]MPV86844.1 hypothetical protein [Ostreibacterium oceani]